MNFPNNKLLILLAYILTAVVLLFPVWYVDMVPMPDFASHMARVHTLSVLETNPALSEIYESAWDFLPNIAVDLFVLGAAEFFPIVIAGKLLITVSVLLWLTGTGLVHRALFDSWDFSPLLASFFVLNACFFLGFLNFYFGAALAILGFAIWISVYWFSPLLRVAIILPITLAAYFSHIVGFLILACCMGGYELGNAFTSPRFAWREVAKRLAIAGIALTPVLAIFVFLSPHEGQASDWLFGDITRSFTRIKFASYLDYGQPYFVALAFLSLLVLAGLVFGKITIDRRMWPVLIGFAVGVAIAPVKFLGGAFVQLRLPPVLGCLGIAALKFRLGRVSGVLVAIGMAVLLIYRSAVMTETWTALDRDYAELARAIASTKAHSKVFLSQFHPDSTAGYEALMVYSHYLDLISVERDSLAPLLMAWPSQHPLRARPAYRQLSATSMRQGIPVRAGDLVALARAEAADAANRFPYLRRWHCNFDYIVNLHLSDAANPAPDFLTEHHQGSYFTLYKIKDARAGCPPPSPSDATRIPRK